MTDDLMAFLRRLPTGQVPNDRLSALEDLVESWWDDFDSADYGPNGAIQVAQLANDWICAGELIAPQAWSCVVKDSVERNYGPKNRDEHAVAIVPYHEHWYHYEEEGICYDPVVVWKLRLLSRSPVYKRYPHGVGGYQYQE